VPSTCFHVLRALEEERVLWSPIRSTSATAIGLGLVTLAREFAEPRHFRHG